MSSSSLFGIILALILVIIIAVGVIFPPADWIPTAQLGESLEASGLRGVLIFFIVAACATAIGLPRQLVAFIGGLAYGVFAGLALSLLAAVTGCFLTVIISRRYFSGLISKRFPEFVGFLQRIVKNDIFIKILILRLQPFGTNLMTNVCIGITSARINVFLLASAVGYIPQMLVFALLGSGVRVGSSAQLRLSIVLLAISLILALYLYRKHRLSI